MNGTKVLDTCLVTGDSVLSWEDAWNICYSMKSRLLEIPSTAYSDAYTPFAFSSADRYRHVGFMRNTSNNPPIRFLIHGSEIVNATWVPLNMVGPPAGAAFPYCGLVVAYLHTLQWLEQICTARNYSYFCQFLLQKSKRILFFIHNKNLKLSLPSICILRSEKFR